LISTPYLLVPLLSICLTIPTTQIMSQVIDKHASLKRGAEVGVADLHTKFALQQKKARTRSEPLEPGAKIASFRTVPPECGDPNDHIRGASASGFVYFDQFDVLNPEFGLVFKTKAKKADSKSTAPGPFINVLTRGGKAQISIASPLGVVRNDAMLFPDGNFDYDLSKRLKDTSVKYQCDSEISLSGRSWCDYNKGPNRQDLGWLQFEAFLMRLHEMLVAHIVSDPLLFPKEKKAWWATCAGFSEQQRVQYFSDQVREKHTKVPLVSYVNGQQVTSAPVSSSEGKTNEVPFSSDFLAGAPAESTIDEDVSRIFNFSRKLYAHKQPVIHHADKGPQRKSAQRPKVVTSPQDAVIAMELRRTTMRDPFRADKQKTPENIEAADALWESATVDLMERQLVDVWDLGRGALYSYHSAPNPPQGAVLSVGFRVGCVRGGDNAYCIRLQPHRLFIYGQLENQGEDLIETEIACEMAPVRFAPSYTQKEQEGADASPMLLLDDASHGNGSLVVTGPGERTGALANVETLPSSNKTALAADPTAYSEPLLHAKQKVQISDSLVVASSVPSLVPATAPAPATGSVSGTVGVVETAGEEPNVAVLHTTTVEETVPVLDAAAQDDGEDAENSENSEDVEDAENSENSDDGEDGEDGEDAGGAGDGERVEDAGDGDRHGK
jgi:hypothetical protein